MLSWHKSNPRLFALPVETPVPDPDTTVPVCYMAFLGAVCGLTGLGRLL